jgi:dipeptide transport system ATP-binding protein
MALLEIRKLSVDFRTAGGLFRAVDRIDLEVNQGDSLAIVGESGSGKSVAMLAVMGLLPWTAKVTADAMSFDGMDLLTMKPRQRRKIIGHQMAMIFQEPMTSLNPCFTVGFQIKEMLKTHLGMTAKERERKAVDLLGQVGIPSPETRLRAFPHQLSGGMSQRVMIAMALSCEPRLLIADEPTTALDVTIQAQILDLLRDLKERLNMALVLITHDMGVVAEMAKDVVVQYAGQQVERRDVFELFAKPDHPYTDALLRALPERAENDILPSIPGTVPGQFDRPTGCLFNPRCDFATDLCRSLEPEFNGNSLCHFPMSGVRGAAK